MARRVFQANLWGERSPCMAVIAAYKRRAQAAGIREFGMPGLPLPRVSPADRERPHRSEGVAGLAKS